MFDRETIERLKELARTDEVLGGTTSESAKFERMLEELSNDPRAVALIMLFNTVWAAKIHGVSDNDISTIFEEVMSDP